MTRTGLVSILLTMFVALSGMDAGSPTTGTARRAQAPAALGDGFHLADTSGVKYVAHDGRSFGIGRRVDLVPSSATLISSDNRNERFHLSVAFPREGGPATPPWRVLVVGGRPFLQSSGGESDATATLGFDVVGHESADALARFFAIEPALRAHPGHAIDVVFAPKHADYAVGATVDVTMRITNVGTDPFAFRQGGMNRGARDNQYAFLARRAGRHVPDVGDAMHFGGLAAKRTVAPGDAFEAVIDLGGWFAFDEPGTYEILGSYLLAFEPPESRTSRTMWESYATAAFTVVIRDP